MGDCCESGMKREEKQRGQPAGKRIIRKLGELFPIERPGPERSSAGMCRNHITRSSPNY